VSADTLYWMYSCSKPITVTAAMQLVEQAALELDAPVARYLPEYADAYYLQDGEPHKVGDTLTVRHLFTMSAGLNYNLESAGILWARDNYHGTATTRELAAAFIRTPLDFAPGDRFQYSLCHDVLGGVIEAVSGQSLGSYLREHIFAPLHMKDTVLHVTEETVGRLSDRWHYIPETGEIRLEPRGDGFTIGEVYESGGGSLVCTLDDYARFADAMACGGMGAEGERILLPETVDLMRTEQLTSLLDDPSFSCVGGPGYGYALGVRTMVDRSRGQPSPLGEFGWDGAAGSYILMDPANRLSVVFAQHLLYCYEIQGQVHVPIRDRVYGALGL
jgi:CubicO group peptidase (beta-lactamase class C family)